MANEWLASSLGELTDWASGGTPPKENPEYWGGDIPWISASSMKSGRLSESDRTLTQKGLEQKSRLARKNDVLLLVRGSELHKRIPVGVATRDVAFNQDVKALRAKNSISSTYLYYWLTAHEPMLLSKVEHTGIGAGKLDTAVLKALPVEVPPVEEQRAIAHILGTLDDKIELNRRSNETLEAMARALFKAWFVDFEPVRAKMEGRWQRGQSLPGLPAHLYDLLPDRLVESELGEIPEGWEVTSLSEFSSLNPESWTKRTRSGEIRYVDLSNTKWGRIESVTNYEADDAPSRAQRVLRPLDTIIGTVRPGNGSYALVSDEGLTGSTGFAVLRPLRRECSEFVYLASTARENIDRLSNLADGGAYPAVRPEIVSATQVPRIGKEIIGEFSRQVSPMLAGMMGNERTSRSLTQLRDTLLPKLVSGELRVPDAERIVGAAV